MIRRILLVTAPVMLGACVPPGAEPAPQPVAPPPRQATPAIPAPRPAPPVMTLVAPSVALAPPAAVASGALAAWADARLSPGSWRYRREPAGQSSAQFGAASGILFQLACGPGRSIALSRPGATGGPLTVRTTSLERALQAAPAGAGIAAQLSANDPLLDAIAFSRGRIAVEAGGTAPLILPAWPELARVIEDCRR